MYKLYKQGKTYSTFNSCFALLFEEIILNWIIAEVLGISCQSVMPAWGFPVTWLFGGWLSSHLRVGADEVTDSLSLLRRFFFGPDNPWLEFTLYSVHRASWGCEGAKRTDFYGYPFLKKIFIDVFLSVLGLRFWVDFFSGCGKWGPLWLRHVGFSLLWLLLSQSVGFRVHGLSCSAACGIVPGEGWNPHLLHWEAEPPGKPCVSVLVISRQGEVAGLHLSVSLCCLFHACVLPSSSVSPVIWPF